MNAIILYNKGTVLRVQSSLLCGNHEPKPQVFAIDTRHAILTRMSCSLLNVMYHHAHALCDLGALTAVLLSHA